MFNPIFTMLLVFAHKGVLCHFCGRMNSAAS